MLEWAREVLADVGLQDGFDWSDLVAFAAGAITVLTFLGMIFRPAWREFKEFLAWWRKFQVDWDGEPGRDGKAPQPGVMQRLDAIDGEFRRNSGKTMKDSQFRTERAVRKIAARQEADTAYRDQTMAIAEANQVAIADALEAAGHERPAYQPFPPPPAIIEPSTEEG